MPDTKVEVLITAKDQASKVFDKVGDAAGTLGTTLATGVVAAGAAVAAGLAASVKSAADFEQSMSAVKAVSGATGEEMAQLGKLALDLGKDTSFSATEAAAGLQELVKGGVSIPDIMNGAAKATLNLAAAGGVDLASAAEIAANALNTFNLKGTDMAHVSDMIAGAANASAIDVSDFKLSMAAAGAVANTIGMSFDDTAVAIAELGNAGIKGSDAGTSLKTMLLNLQPATKAQTELFRELGLITADGSNQFFDAQGKMKGFADVSQTLQGALKGMTEQQKLATLETMFGSDAIRAAAVFAENGAEGFNTLAESMQKVSAETVASERLNNLAGDMEALKGSLETAAIGLGTLFLPALRQAAQGAAEFVNNGIIPFVEQHGPAMMAALSGLKDNITTFAQTAASQGAEALEGFKGAILAAQDSVKEWADSAGPAGEAVKSALDAAYDSADAFQALLKGDFSQAADKAGKALGELGDSAKALGKQFDETREQAQSFMERVGETQEAQDLGKEFGELQSATGELGQAFAAARAAQEAWNAAVQELTSALGIQQSSINVNVSAMDIMKGAISYLTNIIHDIVSVIQSATAVLNGLAAGFHTAAEGAKALAEAARQARASVEAIPRNVTSTITTIKETVEKAVGARAAGGPVKGGHPYIVGEKGPEIFVPGMSGGIVNNQAATSMPPGRASSGGGPIVLQVDGTTLGVLSQAYGTRRIGLATL